jgi:hypothetical protein
VNPDLDPYQSDRYESAILPGSILSNRATIVNVLGLLWLHFEPLQILNFDFNFYPDSAFYSNADPDHHHRASQNDADPDPQLCFELRETIYLAVCLGAGVSAVQRPRAHTPVHPARPGGGSTHI